MRSCSESEIILLCYEYGVTIYRDFDMNAMKTTFIMKRGRNTVCRILNDDECENEVLTEMAQKLYKIEQGQA